jgi:acetylornithine deacetylase/succinyl-diaminopimelate desuccinylase-like protein
MHRSGPLLVLLALFASSPPAPVHAEGQQPLDPVRWLREYLQIDTTNPPGGEAEAAEYLAEILRAEGLEPRLLSTPGGRTSLYLRYPGARSDGRAVALLHHIDVVPTGPSWRVPPFSGRPLQGRLWGRGAIDVKSLGVAHLAALLTLHRAGEPLDRDIIFLAVADEERGGLLGTRWLLENHPELFEGLEGVLGEGGSNRVVNDRLVWWGVEVTQKRPLWLRVKAHGRGGHGSGFHPQSATHQLLRALGRLLERPLRFRVGDAARRYLEAVARLEGGRAEDLFRRFDGAIAVDGVLEGPSAAGLEAYFTDTLQITHLEGSPGTNVVAAEAVAEIDIRLLPDSDGEALLEEIRELLGPRLEVEVLLDAPPAPASPVDHPVFRALEGALSVRGPVIATFMTGTTDSRFFRQRGIPAYGFSPFALDADETRGIHAVDESIPRAELLRGVQTMVRVLEALTHEP